MSGGGRAVLHAMRRAVRVVDHLLFPPACRGCGERFDLFVNAEPQVLCPTCLTCYAAAAALRCARCDADMTACECMPPLLAEAGGAALISAVGYHPGKKQLPERLILRCKRVRDRALFRFFASDLQLRVWQTLEQFGGAEDACVTYVPRRPAARRQAGVDQGRELARAIAKALDLPLLSTLQNRSCVEQKTLDHAARAAQAAVAIAPERRARTDALQGRTVVLVDDITTAGATLAAGCRCLLASGAARVVCVVVARTQI